MARGEFERDMSDYLRARKRARGINVKELFNKFLNKIPRRVEMPEEVEVYHEEEKKETPPKESMLSKLFKREPPNEQALRAKMQAEAAVGDMKEISKITLNMIRQLPDEQLKKFKQSPDFERMKSILKKHELIK